MRTDPFRDLDRLTQHLVGTAAGTWSKPTPMPMDAYRAAEEFVVCFDLPGIDPDAIELFVISPNGPGAPRTQSAHART